MPYIDYALDRPPPYSNATSPGMARAGAGRVVFMAWAALPIAFVWISVGLFVRPALWGEPRRRSPQGGAPVASNSFVGLLRPHRGALSERMTLCVLVTACVELFCFLFEVFVGLYDGLCGLYDGLSDGLYDVHSAFNRIQSQSVALGRIHSHSFAFIRIHSHLVAFFSLSF